MLNKAGITKDTLSQPGHVGDNLEMPTTWAEIDPNMPCINPFHPNMNRTGCATDAEAKRLLAKENAEKHTALMRALEDETECHEKAMESIADEHGRKLDTVWNLAGYSKVFKTAHQANLLNAKMLYKANEMNNGMCSSEIKSITADLI